MSKYLVTVTALAEVWTYIVVEAADTLEASDKAVQEVQRDGAGGLKRERPQRVPHAVRVELITGPDRASGDNTSTAGRNGLRAA